MGKPVIFEFDRELNWVKWPKRQKAQLEYIRDLSKKTVRKNVV